MVPSPSPLPPIDTFPLPSAPQQLQSNLQIFIWAISLQRAKHENQLIFSKNVSQQLTGTKYKMKKNKQLDLKAKNVWEKMRKKCSQKKISENSTQQLLFPIKTSINQLKQIPWKIPVEYECSFLSKQLASCLSHRNALLPHLFARWIYAKYKCFHSQPHTLLHLPVCVCVYVTCAWKQATWNLCWFNMETSLKGELLTGGMTEKKTKQYQNQIVPKATCSSLNTNHPQDTQISKLTDTLTKLCSHIVES